MEEKNKKIIYKKSGLNEIRQNLLYRKDKAEKSLAFHAAAIIASIVYGFIFQFTFWPLFFFALSSLNVWVSLTEYKRIEKVKVLFESVEKRFLKGEITEERAIQELMNHK